MEICNECPCNCRPIDVECISTYSDIKDPTVLQSSHYQKATDDIDDLIGLECSEQLCAALKQAVSDYNDSIDPDKKLSDFLDSIWTNIIENKHFKSWYSNRLLWHWLHGASISELSLSGLITLSNDDSVKNSFSQAEEKERLRLQKSASFYAQKSKEKFIYTYWNDNAHLYNCIQSDCEKKLKENCTIQAPPNNGIGMTII